MCWGGTVIGYGGVKGNNCLRVGQRSFQKPASPQKCQINGLKTILFHRNGIEISITMAYFLIVNKIWSPTFPQKFVIFRQISQIVHNCIFVVFSHLSTMSTALPKAKLGSESGLLEPITGEKELKRCTKVLLGDAPCTVTLTNKRIIITSRSETTPKELKLSEVVKSKLPTGGMFSGGKAKAGKVPELTIKLADDSKYKFTFTQYVFSIYTPVEERDDFLQMLTDNLADKENPKDLNQ
jgi:hypothetical protein